MIDCLNVGSGSCYVSPPTQSAAILTSRDASLHVLHQISLLIRFIAIHTRTQTYKVITSVSIFVDFVSIYLFIRLFICSLFNDDALTQTMYYRMI